MIRHASPVKGYAAEGGAMGTLDRAMALSDKGYTSKAGMIVLSHIFDYRRCLF